MHARYSASRLVLCSLAILLLAAACAPSTSPDVPLGTAAPAVPTVVATAAPSPALTAVAPAPTAAASDRLVFASDRGGSSTELYVVDVPPAGATPAGPLPARQLTSDGKNSFWPVVSPDSRWIAYVVEDTDPAKMPPQRDIWLLSIDGQKRFNLTQNPASNIEPSWSPDGSQIAFASTRNGELSIWIQDVAPILAGQAPAPRKLVDVGNNPVWSPDGTQIAYLAAEDGGNFTQLYTIKPDGSGQRQLTAHSSDASGSGILVPAWQPDGRWMLVPMYFGPNCQLVLLPVEGTTAPIPDKDLRVVTPGEEYAETPAWEADGRWVAFRAGRDPNASIALMDMQSGEVRRIAPQLAGMTPAWSPDGSRLAFAVQGPAPDYNVDIYITDRDGSNPLNVTNSLAFDINPAWVPPNQRPE